MNEPVSNAPELSVSELAGALKRTIEDAFGFVRLRGEISGYRGPHSSGHVYFSIKDQNARIDAVIWKGVFGRLRFRPEEGMEVVATGKITTFPGKSNYQIVVEGLEPAGVGALMALLDERRKKLAAEGVFDASRKRPLPYLPEVIGIITSPTGAVIRDMIHRLSDRFPRHVIVWPVRVQGEGSAEEVARAIDGFNDFTHDGEIIRPDVLVVARGGGSLEDLWGFNEEIVVRAAQRSEIPIISAVGHETDWTLLDLVADIRAPTPTAAAEMLVPVRADLLAMLRERASRMLNGIRKRHEREKRELAALIRAMPDAAGLLDTPRQRLDLADLRGKTALESGLSKRRLALSERARKLSAQRPEAVFARMKERLGQVGKRLENGLAMRITLAKRDVTKSRTSLETVEKRMLRTQKSQQEARLARLASLGQLLGAFGYQQVLNRGFVLVRDEADQPVRLAAQVVEKQALVLQFSDGRVGAVSGGDIRPVARPAPRPAKPRGDQGSLF